MRRTIFFICFIGLSFSSFSQELKGKFLLTGGLNFSIFEQDQNNIYNFGVNPRLLYCFHEKWATGLDIRFNYLLIAGSWRNLQSINPSIGLVLRRSLYQKEKFGVFLDFVPRINYFNEWDEVTTETKRLTLQFFLSPGIYYRITPKIWLEANFSSLSSQYELFYSLNGIDRPVENHFNLIGDFQASIGNVKIGWLF